MKKIMIIAAVLLTALCSEAASVRWRAANVKDITGSAAYSGDATLYAMLGDTIAASYAATMTGGMINSVVGSEDLVTGSTYSFYYTMTDKEGNVFTSTTVANIVAQATSTPTVQFAAGGTWAAVPEPTSGLLMLVGLAGLALRRRRA
jgi:hypothetical protein